MAEADLLYNIAQLAVAFAGFSGIALIFTRRPGELSSPERFRLLVLLGASLDALFLALLPSVLHTFALPASVIWRVSSALMVTVTVVLFLIFIPLTRQFAKGAPGYASRPFLALIYAGHSVNMILQGLNALGYLAPQYAGYYVVGLCWILLHTALQFGRILFVPIPPADPVSHNEQPPNVIGAPARVSTRDDQTIEIVLDSMPPDSR